MRTVHVTLDEQLVADADRAAKTLGMTRPGFTRSALRAALRELTTREQERRHRAGYARQPVRRGDFDVW
jgi:metal-responsive CopG/Arc/MetJ family transcriptional regulator